jgi:hypothetical protein
MSQSSAAVAKISYASLAVPCLLLISLLGLAGCSGSAPTPTTTPVAVKTANPYKGGTLPSKLDSVEATPFLAFTAEINKTLSSVNKEPGVFVLVLSPGDPMKGFLVLLSSETDVAKVATQKSVKTAISGDVKTLEAPELKKLFEQSYKLSLAGEGTQVQFVSVSGNFFEVATPSQTPSSSSTP